MCRTNTFGFLDKSLYGIRENIRIAWSRMSFGGRHDGLSSVFYLSSQGFVPSKISAHIYF
jgi:hypothetical protein